jgi:ribosomal protein L7Ae-like RNA K-turn-binding protein
MSGANRGTNGTESEKEKVRGLLGLARRAREVAIGSRETRSALRKGRIALVLLAGDGSSRDGERLKRIADEEGVPVRTVSTREELGSWVGFGPVSVLGLTDRRLAAALRDRLDGARGESRDGRPSRGQAGGERET